MNKIKNILKEYCVAYIVNALITYIMLSYNNQSLLATLIDIIVNWILLTIILIFINRDNNGRFAI